MKKIAFLLLLIFVYCFISCNNQKQSYPSRVDNISTNEQNSIIGTWTEYRENPKDDYLITHYKFNADGSGIFTVDGYTNTRKVSFLWKKNGESTYIINLSSDETTINVQNGQFKIYSNLDGDWLIYKKE